MDGTDIKIINCLSVNSRINASDIAEKVNLSVSAVIERIKKLEASGVIKKYTVILDNASLGKDISAMMFVNMENPRFNGGFENMVKTHSQITECNYMAGDYDYLIKIVTANTSSLERVLNDIKCVPGVSKTRTSIVLSSIKQEYSTPLPAPKKN
jgi:Lrp/AsnC family leucine-responsive transcriptional regulator